MNLQNFMNRKTFIDIRKIGIMNKKLSVIDNVIIRYITDFDKSCCTILE